MLFNSSISYCGKFLCFTSVVFLPSLLLQACVSLFMPTESLPLEPELLLHCSFPSTPSHIMALTFDQHFILIWQVFTDISVHLHWTLSCLPRQIQFTTGLQLLTFSNCSAPPPQREKFIHQRPAFPLLSPFCCFSVFSMYSEYVKFVVTIYFWPSTSAYNYIKQ